MSSPETANTDQNKLETRLFNHLETVLDVSLKKFNNHRKQDKTRQSWARIILQAINAYCSLKQLVTLEELRERIEKLEVT